MSDVPFSIRFILRNKALRFPTFRNYLLTRLTLIMALNMQTTIIVYWVYLMTNDVKTVGMLGLFEAIPAIGFSLISGHFVDQREKRTLLSICIAGYVLLAAGYVSIASESFSSSHSVDLRVHLIYAGIFIGGFLRAFMSPSSFALMAMLIPKKLIPNAATWSSTAWQSGAVLGPLMGGILIALIGIPKGLMVAFFFALIALLAALRIPRQPILLKIKEPVLQSLREGMRFVFSSQLILAALSLDMFAVLFGGAVALLPAYAKDILKVGEVGYGWLRAAPGIGSVIMVTILSWMPLKNKPGIKLLFSIAGFGACMLIFGISKVFAISFAALLFSGMFDAVSVVIRSTILQLYTPDAVRGRVAAVNTMFVSSSNEIGEVESGFTAKYMGTIPAVVFGGCMTLLVVGVTYFAAPLLRTLKLEAPPEDEKKDIKISAAGT